MKTLFFIGLLVCLAFAQVQQKEFVQLKEHVQEGEAAEKLEEEAPRTTLTAADVKLTASIDILTTEGLTSEVYLQAIADAFDALFKGHLFVLPGKSADGGMLGADWMFYNKTLDMVNRFLNALEMHATMIEGLTEEEKLIMQEEIPIPQMRRPTTTTTTKTVTEETATTESKLTEVTFSSQVAALDAWDLLLMTKEILEVLSESTMRCDVNVAWNLQSDPSCSWLKSADEGGDVIDTVLKQGDMNNMKSIRSPFFFFNKESRPGSYALTHQTGILKDGECSAVVETLVGLKAVLRAAPLTLWNMPFAEGLDLHGQKHFVFEWMPSEFIKTITLCNPTTGTTGLTTNVETKFVHMRGGLQFWRMWTLGSQH